MTRDILIHEIRTEIKEPFYKKSSPYRDSVWFKPDEGKFLYNDLFIKRDLITEMIKDGILVYKGIGMHQNEQMLQYKLNKLLI